VFVLLHFLGLVCQSHLALLACRIPDSNITRELLNLCNGNRTHRQSRTEYLSAPFGAILGIRNSTETTSQRTGPVLLEAAASSFEIREVFRREATRAASQLDHYSPPTGIAIEPIELGLLLLPGSSHDELLRSAVDHPDSDSLLQIRASVSAAVFCFSEARRLSCDYGVFLSGCRASV
jgi:hypothetical protein